MSTKPRSPKAKGWTLTWLSLKCARFTEAREFQLRKYATGSQEFANASAAKRHLKKESESKMLTSCRMIRLVVFSFNTELFLRNTNSDLPFVNVGSASIALQRICQGRY